MVGFYLLVRFTSTISVRTKGVKLGANNKIGNFNKTIGHINKTIQSEELESINTTTTCNREEDKDKET